MANWISSLFSEIRPNFLYDVIKVIVFGAVSVFIVFGYRMISFARGIPQDRVIDLAVFATAFILLSVAYFLMRVASRSGAGVPSLAPSPATPIPVTAAVKVEERIIVNVPPVQLIESLAGHTMADGQRLAAPYIAKWIKASGSVDDLYKSGSCWVVYLKLDSPQASFVSLRFRDEAMGQASVLRKGEQLSVLGQIEEINTFGHLTLDNCEFT